MLKIFMFFILNLKRIIICICRTDLGLKSFPWMDVVLQDVAACCACLFSSCQKTSEHQVEQGEMSTRSVVLVQEPIETVWGEFLSSGKIIIDNVAV